MESKRELTQLSEAERAASVARYETLRPHLEEGVPLARIARRQGLNLRTLQRWLQRYQANGLSGLARCARSDKGKRTVPTQLQQFIEGLALRQPAPSIAYIHRQAIKLAVEQGWGIPGYFSVRNVVHAIEPALLTLAHEGSKVYQERFDVLYMRTSVQPNAIWQADHSWLEVTLVNEKGQPAQPWLTLVMDDYSRAVAGYIIRFEAPSAIGTALALRQAIWRKEDPRWQICGIPEVFYTDHGSDFTSQHIEQVCLDLKIHMKFSIPGQPRGRGRIERFFQTVEQTLLSELPGYTPKQHPPVTKPELTLDEFDTLFREFLLNSYHQRPHSAHGLTPQAAWSVRHFLPQMPTSLEELDLLLLTVAQPRKVRQDGIHFQSYRYFDMSLAAYIGEQVTVRYDPRDLAEIRVFHAGQFLCRAICQELAGQTLSLEEIVRQRRARQRDLRGVLRDREELVKTYLKVHYEEPLPAPAAEQDTPRKPLKSYYNE